MMSFVLFGLHIPIIMFFQFLKNACCDLFLLCFFWGGEKSMDGCGCSAAACSYIEYICITFMTS